MTRRQQLTLVAAIIGSALTTIDGSIVNVALSAIEHDLGGGLVRQQWISNAYLFALCSLIVVVGSMGDITASARSSRSATESHISRQARGKEGSCPDRRSFSFTAGLGPADVADLTWVQGPAQR